MGNIGKTLIHVTLKEFPKEKNTSLNKKKKRLLGVDEISKKVIKLDKDCLGFLIILKRLVSRIFISKKKEENCCLSFKSFIDKFRRKADSRKALKAGRPEGTGG